VGSVIVLATFVAGCHRPDAQARAEAARLRRQIAGLRALGKAADQGTLFPPDRLRVGVREALVRDLLRAPLPLETTILDRFRVRLTDANVRFEHGLSLVLLEGRAHMLADPERYADFTLAGDLHDIGLDPTTGHLTGRVALDHVELKQVGSASMEPGLARTFIEALAGRGLGAIGEVVPPIEIPTRLDRAVESRGFDDGRVFVAPARMPLTVAVDRVLPPFGGRLWIILKVEAAR
jgi:hypothetical protein